MFVRPIATSRLFNAFPTLNLNVVGKVLNVRRVSQNLVQVKIVEVYIWVTTGRLAALRIVSSWGIPVQAPVGGSGTRSSIQVKPRLFCEQQPSAIESKPPLLQ